MCVCQEMVWLRLHNSCSSRHGSLGKIGRNLREGPLSSLSSAASTAAAELCVILRDRMLGPRFFHSSAGVRRRGLRQVNLHCERFGPGACFYYAVNENGMDDRLVRLQFSTLGSPDMLSMSKGPSRSGSSRNHKTDLITKHSLLMCIRLVLPTLFAIEKAVKRVLLPRRQSFSWPFLYLACFGGHSPLSAMIATRPVWVINLSAAAGSRAGRNGNPADAREL